MKNVLSFRKRREIAKKPLVYLAIPAGDNRVTVSIACGLSDAGLLTASPNHKWAYAPFMPSGVHPVALARNQCMEVFLNDDRAEKLFFIDADMGMPTYWWKLLDHDAPLVSGITFGWQAERRADSFNPYSEPGCVPVAYTWDETKKKFVTTVPEYKDRPFMCDGVGAACLIIDKKFAKSLTFPWFKTLHEPNGRVEVGEDLYMMRQARERGVRVLVDPRYAFGHWKDANVMDIANYGMACRDVGARIRKEAGHGAS